MCFYIFLCENSEFYRLYSLSLFLYSIFTHNNHHSLHYLLFFKNFYRHHNAKLTTTMTTWSNLVQVHFTIIIVVVLFAVLYVCCNITILLQQKQIHVSMIHLHLLIQNKTKDKCFRQKHTTACCHTYRHKFCSV